MHQDSHLPLPGIGICLANAVEAFREVEKVDSGLFPVQVSDELGWLGRVVKWRSSLYSV